MLAKLALAIFVMVNGSPVGPLGVAIFDAPFKTEQACKDFVDSPDSEGVKAMVAEFATGKYGPHAVVVPECVTYDPEVVTPKTEDRGAYIPTWGNVS